MPPTQLKVSVAKTPISNNARVSLGHLARGLLHQVPLQITNTGKDDLMVEAIFADRKRYVHLDTTYLHPFSIPPGGTYDVTFQVDAVRARNGAVVGDTIFIRSGDPRFPTFLFHPYAIISRGSGTIRERRGDPRTRR